MGEHFCYRSVYRNHRHWPDWSASNCSQADTRIVAKLGEDAGHCRSGSYPLRTRAPFDRGACWGRAATTNRMGGGHVGQNWV